MFFEDDFRKRKNRALLDAQVFVKKDVNWGSFILGGLLVGAVAAFIYFTFFAPVNHIPNPPMVDKSRQAKLQNVRDEEERRLKVIAEDPENMCVAWREVDGCISDGTRQAFKDADCRSDIMPWQTGWCECKDKAGTSFQVPFDCRTVDHSKRKTSITCARTCRDRILGGREKFERLSRAHQATAQRAESLMEIENRKKEEAARRRQEEEEKAKQAAVVRGMIQKGDDLLADIFTKIDEKDLAAAERMLSEARDWYERAGVVDVSKPDGSSWELHELYRKPEATAKELAISGVADKLLVARQQEEQEREALELERQRQEAAVRYAATEIERRQREQLEEIRRRHDERMRELARQAQEEALQLMRNKKAIEEEDRVRRSMTAEQLAERERQLHAKWVAEERARNGSHDDPEALEAQRKYAEFLAGKRRDVDGAPTLSPAQAAAAAGQDAIPAKASAAAAAAGSADDSRAASVGGEPALPAERRKAAEAANPVKEAAAVRSDKPAAVAKEVLARELPAAAAKELAVVAEAPATVETVEADVDDAQQPLSVPAVQSAVPEAAAEKFEKLPAPASEPQAAVPAAEPQEALTMPAAESEDDVTQAAAEAAPAADVEEVAVPATETEPPARPPAPEPVVDEEVEEVTAAGAPTVAAAPGQKAASDLVTELFAAGLSAHEDALREIGVETVGDLRYLDEGIIELLPLQQNHKHSLRQLVHKFASL